MNSRSRAKPNGFNSDRVKRAVKEMHIEDYNVNQFYDMTQDSLAQPDEDEMTRIFGTFIEVFVDVGDFNVRYRWIKFGDNIELISLTESDSLFKYGRNDPMDSWEALLTRARALRMLWTQTWLMIRIHTRWNLVFSLRLRTIHA